MPGLAHDELVENVVLRLNAIRRAATFDFVMGVGALIVETFYSGDLTAWRMRGRKEASFRRLSRHPDLPMSSVALYRCVAIYEMCERLGIRNWKHVTTTHLRVVLPLPPETQRQLLDAAESSCWSVRRIEEVAANLQTLGPSAHRHRGGRKPCSRVRTAVQVVEGRLCAVADALDAGGPDIESSPHGAQDILEILGRVRQMCAVAEERVARYLQMPPGDPPPSKHRGDS